jgi:hypothetical protein
MIKFVVAFIFFFQILLFFSQEKKTFKFNVVTESQIFGKFDSTTIYFKILDDSLNLFNENMKAFIFNKDTLDKLNVFNYSKRNEYKFQNFGFIDGLRSILFDKANCGGIEISFEYLEPMVSHCLYIMSIIITEELVPVKLSFYKYGDNIFECFPTPSTTR